MPSLDEHLQAGGANEHLSQRLAEMGEFGWAITCLFYSALHMIEAQLLRLGIVSANHRQRDLYIRRDPDLSSILRPYALLKRESENARYECITYSARDVTRLRRVAYAPLVTHVHRLLGVS